MAIFDERERGFESKFQREEEFAFKVAVRRNKLFGYWAAARLGLTGGEAEAYAGQLIVGDVRRVHRTEDIVNKVAGDFTHKGILLDLAQIKAELHFCAAEARRQLTNE